MYGDLAKRLREGAIKADSGNEISESLYHDVLQAADAIETLYAVYTESFSVIAKAFRNNPKDLVLREYMMKNACCCEVEEAE